MCVGVAGIGRRYDVGGGVGTRLAPRAAVVAECGRAVGAAGASSVLDWYQAGAEAGGGRASAAGSSLCDRPERVVSILGHGGRAVGGAVELTHL